MVQRHRPAVGHEAVDHLELVRLQGDAVVALGQLILVRLGQFREHSVQNVAFTQGDYAQAPTGGPEVFGPGINADGVIRYRGEKRDEALGEGAIDIVGQDDQVRTFGFDDLSDPVDGRILDFDRGRVAGVGDKEGLDLGVQQFVDLAVGDLPTLIFAGRNFNFHELVVVEPRDFQVGSKNRRTDRDRVPHIKNLIFLEGLEDIGHGRGAALGGKQVEGAVKGPAGPELLTDVSRADRFAVLQHAVGHRVMVADDGIAELKQQVGGRDAQLLVGVVGTLFQKIDAGRSGVILDKLIETGFKAICLGVAPEVLHVAEGALGFT